MLSFGKVRHTLEQRFECERSPNWVRLNRARNALQITELIISIVLYLPGVFVSLFRLRTASEHNDEKKRIVGRVRERKKQAKKKYNALSHHFIVARGDARVNFDNETTEKNNKC